MVIIMEGAADHAISSDLDPVILCCLFGRDGSLHTLK
jgi:hypothetical protein